MRHGQSSYNVQRRIQGRSDESTLTDEGRTSARQLGKALSELQFDALYTSPLKRAYETAAIARECLVEKAQQVGGGNPSSVPALVASEQLLEINLPAWEKMQGAEVKQQYPEKYQCWRERPHEFSMQVDGVERFPVQEIYQQARGFWQDVLPKHAGKTILCVAHNGISRALIGSAIGLNPAYYHYLLQSNCCINVLNFSGGWGDSVQLESLNVTNHLGQALPQPRDGVKGLRFLLVRHGETEWNREKRFQGQIDVPLNETGRQQGQQAAKFLESVPVQFAVTSPLLRPKETAELILKSHPSVALEDQDLLLEISHGLWEGKFESEIEAEFPGELQRWKDAPETVQMPEGENLQQVWERAIAAWQQIVESVAARATEEPCTCLVVAHDAVNKALLCHLIGLGPEAFWVFKQGNGAVSVIDYRQGASGPPSLQAANITAHLSGGILDRTAAGAL